MTQTRNTDWLDELKSLLKAEQFSTGASVLEQHSRGESYAEAVLPDVVVFPESTQDVQAILRFSNSKRIPVTPVAVNSSLEGHTVPLLGGISLDLSRMNRILEFKIEDLFIIVEPAVTYPQVNEHIRRSGLFFPIDPGAHASIGGMVSTNASGTMAVRYGVTGDYILALEVVTPTGDIIRSGSRARKSASGYNLNRLFNGAEGTLGVITEITLRLVGLPEAARAARVPFADYRSAASFVTSLIQSGVPVARCELIDPLSIRAVNSHKGTDYPQEITVFLEFHGNEAGLSHDASFAEQLAAEHKALSFESSSQAEERTRLWDARHSMYYACVAANPDCRNMTTDVTVPISHLADAITEVLTDCEAARLRTFLVGHVGDGNFHLSIFYPDDPTIHAEVEAITHAMVMRALAVGGTCTGEHGVGIRKLKYMEQEHGASLEVMRAIKQALDPNGIMNPGKKLP